MLAQNGSVVRWAKGDGAITSQDGSSMSEAAVLALCTTLGVYETTDFTIERVQARYCTPADVVAYGSANGDSFGSLTTNAIWDAIQRAEEAIEQSCGRSFTKRVATVRLGVGFCELPMQDVRTVASADVIGDRQCLTTTAGDHVVTYGARPSASLRNACARLAASYLRPRVGAENARGTSMDGVYVSYTLADGAEGSWTGIPSVDAFIEQNRSRRVMVV